MKYEKYTKEILQKAAKQSLSILAVLRELNIPYTTSNHRHIKSRLNFYNIDISHFLGKRVNSGSRFKGGHTKLTADTIFVLDRNSGRRESSARLKKYLILSGIKEICHICGIGPEWNSIKLVLQVDHINGNGIDNRKENLRFLCPNCHSQTENFGNKNVDYSSIIKKIKPSEINPNWRNDPKPNIRKTIRPSKEELEKLLWQMPTTKIAEQFGVSDNAIGKWAKAYNITKPGRGYWSKNK